MPVPSGRQVLLRYGSHRATVVEVGGGLRTYDVAGVPVLDGYTDAQICPAGRGQVLIPWPNRVPDGRYSFEGDDYQLPINEVERNTSIHGLVRWARWDVDNPASHLASATHELPPQPGWPFELACRVDYELSEAGLTVTTSARNLADVPCPFGVGHHPYVTADTGTLDSQTLRIPARTVLAMDGQGRVTGRSEVVETEFAPLRETALDTPFTDLVRDGDGLCRVRLTGSNGTVEVWMDEAWPYLQVFTGDTLGAQERRRGLAVEPMTCPPAALASGEGVIVLQPGESFTGRWGIFPRGG